MWDSASDQHCAQLLCYDVSDNPWSQMFRQELCVYVCYSATEEKIVCCYDIVNVKSCNSVTPDDDSCSLSVTRVTFVTYANYCDSSSYLLQICHHRLH